jgi:hypothetical protein
MHHRLIVQPHPFPISCTYTLQSLGMDEVLQYHATWCIPLAATSTGQLRLFIPAITARHVGLKTTCAPVETTDHPLKRYA